MMDRAGLAEDEWMAKRADLAEEHKTVGDPACAYVPW